MSSRPHMRHGFAALWIGALVMALATPLRAQAPDQPSQPAAGSDEDDASAAQPAGDGATSGADTAGAATGGANAGDKPSGRVSDGWAILPAAYYNPERGFAASAALLRYFHLDPRSTKPSQVRLEGTVTVAGELIFRIKPQLWFGADDYMIRGDLAFWQLDRRFYGIGNDTADSDEENYEARKWSAHVEATKRITTHLSAGPFYYIKHLSILTADEGGLVAEGAVLGADGGILSGPGLLVQYDSRDHPYGPRTGWLAQASARVYWSALGSDHDVGETKLDIRRYIPLPRQHVLAVQFVTESRIGDSPFHSLPLAGGKRLLRGMRQGRYRDNHFAGGQVEYRMPLFWRFGGVAFAGLGRVASSVSDFDLSGWKYSVGAGLRFAAKPKDRINVRLDVGLSDGDVGVYVDILEAF